MEIYQPSDDSYFFQEFLEKYFSNVSHLPPPTFLDMGTASGILTKTAAKFIDKKNITAIDINPDAVKNLKKNFNAIKSDLFEKIPTKKFDLITFNAPYLPEDKREPKDSRVATTGGKNGDEVSLKFLKQAKSHLNPKGKIFLLISSLTPINKIKKFNPKIVARKRIPLEELLILEFKNE